LATTRTRSKLVRLTPEEFAEIERRARTAGTVPARFLRDSALSDRTSAHPQPTSADLLHSLATIGADLKALARSAPDDTTRARCNVALDELVAVLRQLTRPERE
jgi:hypothetical protein